MKKIVLMSVGILSFVVSYAYVYSPYMYEGPEVQEEMAEGSAYVPPDREFINSRYGEYIDNRETEFRPDQDAQRLFWSYSQP
ncbi:MULTISPECIES: hypothetical protein [unclassified Francisella]|uniref:hypothetical protein n=1 Tax=unclassified Francisella TaxID=2610885 RepID=UPI002E37CD04|nr:MULTISPECIES: hypothetical protein [unclassified Francisella]MED7819085.1 hypothetical protein [Francisella sp. 19S2-4]MED7829955.1 hypothetical protein [Francisella sp. 19S2-10]